MEFLVRHDSLNSFAADFWKQFQSNKVFAFSGEMGAGKTTLITELCRHLGVKSSMGSPTFSIINQYECEAGSVYHLDLYRLNSEVEAIQAGVEDVLYSGSICFIEWPERALKLLPQESVWIEIAVLDANTRKVSIRNA